MALILAGCGEVSANGTDHTVAVPPSPPSLAAPRHTTAVHPPGKPPGRPPRKVESPRGLAYSTASAQVGQAQPAPGSCHAIGHAADARPDPHCTPGALNPAVTQADIHQTICQAGWTETVRPPEQVTEAEKAQSMAAYGDVGAMSGYEYDHLIPLELGGAVNDPRNLWPEPAASPNPKDAVESDLNQRVCDGEMTLAAAQRAIAANWVKLAAPRSSPPASRSAHCSASASYSSHYGDFDVYVHSNQPDARVTVGDSSGRSDTWHTNGSGYADVYFKAPAAASGETVTVTVGSASCRTVL